MTRPGPDALEPGVLPGGLVLHVYSTRSELLVAQPIRSVVEALDGAALAADVVKADPRSVDGVCLVAFDGDTGRRWSTEDWARARDVTGLGPPRFQP